MYEKQINNDIFIILFITLMLIMIRKLILKSLINNEVFIGSTVNITSLEGEKDWITNASKNGDVNFAIVEKKTDELIGNCSLMKLDRINRRCTIGIFIGDEENRNKGYGVEALELLLNYAFNFQNMHNINLCVFSFNERAIKCYKKIGFKEYGRRHEVYFLDGKYYDIVEMEILEDDFKKIIKV